MLGYLNKKVLIAIPIVVAALATFTILRTQGMEEQERSELAQAIEQEELQREQDARVFEQEIFKLTNEVRLQQGKSALQWNDQLADFARMHSTKAANGDIEFKHNTFNYYLQNVSICKTYAGENLADWIGTSTESDAKEVVDGWMRSIKGHGENMLHEEWQYSGVGYAVSSLGHVYLTQAFCT
jgi:uncharacterized protein YkwD